MKIKEVRIPGLPTVYRLVKVGSDGKEKLTCRFRVRKRVKVGGKWTTKVQTFENFDDAKRFSKKALLFNGEPIRSDKFEDVFERFIKHKRVKEQLAQGSLDGYRVRAKHFQLFEGLTMQQLTYKTVDAWLDLLFSPEYLQLLQKNRVNFEHEYFVLSGVFTYYRNHENEEFKNPLLQRHREIACRRKRGSEIEIRYLSSTEESDFLGRLKNEIHDIALFQLHTGARIGEAAALEFHNVDFRENEVRIAQHLHWERKEGSKIELLPGTKGGPSRRVFLTPECREMLLQRRQYGSSKVFEAPRGGWLTYRAIQAIYDRTFKEMGVPHSGTHTLRHSFAVRFLEQTKDIHALQKLLGHADLKDTQRYAKYTNDSVRRSFQLFRGGLATENEGTRSTVRSTEVVQL